MNVDKVIPAQSREDLRTWLHNHSATEACCWVVVSMKPVPGVLLYLDAVEEALCFGWIDGIKKNVSGTELAQRLSPRSKKSSWTELNKERVRRLERLGLMTDAGRRVLPDMDSESFVMDREIKLRLQADEQAYAHFIVFPKLYQRVRIDTIQSVRNQPEVFESRLEKFLANTRANRMYGQWNDNGRLLET
ncbi:YdeI/OmpD-associated family protein [Paenibacillus athensensis]|uniref:Thymidylate synthase n=1 Tax=Paenibacillus athensensis TaxID=1967502 RepID=A0A4Y8Q4H4_9BACL|nr:YdeI/OmpD-associated family protein [Paenibacillus athensensis]MCD1258372.1 YdeI/OmpD-associated family protein [Paenibacillus athensensis]